MHGASADDDALDDTWPGVLEGRGIDVEADGLVSREVTSQWEELRDVRTERE